MLAIQIGIEKPLAILPCKTNGPQGSCDGSLGSQIHSQVYSRQDYGQKTVPHISLTGQSGERWLV